MKKFTRILLAALLASLTTTGISIAADYDYRIMGVVDRIDVQSGEIVIDDTLYHLGPNYVVRDKRNGIAKPNKLKKGSKIGANSYSNASDQFIHEIRLLPDNFDLGSKFAGPELAIEGTIR